jgi:hypothetical protein
MAAVGRADRVARLVEGLHHMRDFVAAENRDLADRSVSNDRDITDALDAARIGPCRNVSEHPSSEGIDGDHGRLQVRRYERDRARLARAQREWRRGRTEQEFAAVHRLGYGSAGGEVQPGEDPIDLVRERALDVDQLVRDRAGTLEQRPVLAQMCEAEVCQAGLSCAQ